MIIMRFTIFGLLSMMASVIARSPLFHHETELIERQANTSSLNATLLEIITDVEEAKTCGDCEVCKPPHIADVSCLLLQNILLILQALAAEGVEVFAEAFTEFCILTEV